jgi:ribosomal protein S18 acetylase RimI-like enzyme
LQIRPLTTNDYDQIMQLYNKSGLHIRPHGRESEQAINKQIKANPEFLIGAFEESQLVGAVIASSDGRKGWINRLAVDPEFRRRGIARALVAEAEKILRKNGINVFCALVMDSNMASKGLFRKLGYEELEDVKYFSKRESEEA